MTKTVLDKTDAKADLFFQPSSRRSRRRQLQISERRLLLIAGDVLAVVVSVLIGLRIWAMVARLRFTVAFIEPQSYLFVALVGLWLLLASANDLYDLRIASNRRKTFQRLVLINLQMLFLYALVFFFSPRTALPRLFILYYAVASIVLIGVWRFAQPFLIGWASEPRRTLIVGADAAAQTIAEAIAEHASSEYEITGIIGTSDDVGRMIGSIPVVGTGSDLMNFTARDRVSELIITSTHQVEGEMFQAVMDAYERGISLVPMSLLYERITGRVAVEHLSADWAVALLPMRDDSPLFQMNQYFKRLFDLVLSVIGMVLLGVLLPFLALLIRLDSAGDIFYSQERVGLNGRLFRIYKFRSMVTDAEASTGAVFSQRGDARVTRVGRIMRKSRLDELPQFLNVLRGDMSLIGPRPERPEHVTRLTTKIPFYRTRLIVRPGISGWAQVRYEYGSNDEDALIKLQYDLFYIRHQSFLLDLNILIRTIGKALAFKGI